jgi:hypothetical protein
MVKCEREPPVVAVSRPTEAHVMAGRLHNAANDASASKAWRAET